MRTPLNSSNARPPIRLDQHFVAGRSQFSGDHRPLHIVMIAPPYFDVPPAGYGGIEAVMADLADALVVAGHRVSLIGVGRPGTRARFISVSAETIADRLGEVYPELLHAARTRNVVEHLVRTETVDVIHDHSLSGPINAAWYTQAGIPTVVTMHGPVDQADLVAFYRHLGTAVHMVAISERQRALTPDLNWVRTVHNALTIDAWPYRPDKSDYALFLGRFSPEKGAHLALDAAHEVGVPLILAGKCVEPREKRYLNEEVIPRLKASDTMFGVADAVAKRRLLSEARCLLFPVVWEEPFGMVMIEAMACGTPVVALRAGSVPEIVIDGVTGLVREKPEELADALNAVADIDPAACRRHVAENFNAAGLAAGYVAAYRAAIRTMSARPVPSI